MHDPTCACGKKMSEHREQYCEKCGYAHTVCEDLVKFKERR